MHDTVTLERNGIPTVALVTEPYRGSVTNMARLKGFPNYPFVVLPHPVSSLSRQDIEELVQRAFPQILALLLARPRVEVP